MTGTVPARPHAAVEHAGTDRRLAAILAAALGIVTVFAAGFAPGEAARGAADDTRHSFSFPCHQGGPQ